MCHQEWVFITFIFISKIPIDVDSLGYERELPNDLILVQIFTVHNKYNSLKNYKPKPLF